MSIGFRGAIVLIHADLGKVEWSQSLPKCRELSTRLGCELIIVKRAAGGMLERWQGRWKANVDRWENLSCVKIILPWSSAAMRFCTSELKVAPICSELKKRFNGMAIVNAMGIRREESCSRAKKPVSSSNGKLSHKTPSKKTGMATFGIDWNPIIEWKVDDVFSEIRSIGMEPHEAYTKFGMSRVSCMFCILSNQCDLLNATKANESHSLYRDQVELEIASTFSFQAKWLGDVNPSLLTEDQRIRLAQAKVNAERRIAAESRIPKHMLYTNGWPHSVPSYSDAALLAEVRIEVGEALGLQPKYSTAESIVNRYTELLELKESKNDRNNSSRKVESNR
jgi:3'-phosphoadenosine 5'-phosphosulfate sulfotransferase (PAPS reductase)/FAD synthetase